MHTLFPVQSSEHDGDHKSELDININVESIQGSLIHDLVECCLLEHWVDESLITETTTTDYLARQDLMPALKSLPIQYQACFAQDNPLLILQNGANRRLLLLVEPAYATPWRLHKSCLPMLHVLHGYHDGPNLDSDSLEPIKEVQSLLDIFLSMMDRAALSEPGVLKLKESLEASLLAKKHSAAANITTEVYKQAHWHQTLIAAEQWASLMDRPFHPLAKGKLGFTSSQYQRYMAEFNQPIKLVWVAVAHSHIMAADSVVDMTLQNPAAYLLTQSQQHRIEQELQNKGLAHTHIAMPVHPWQMAHVVDNIYADEFTDGTAVTLAFAELTTYASSSLRSMLIDADTPHSIKLPIGIYALNSKRYLPALKLINGEKNQAILRQARTIDAVLGTQLRLWDESLWWGYMSPSHLHDKSAINPHFYQEKPTHLGAMLRKLPVDLCDDNSRLLPMASLGMLVYKQGVSHHIFDDIIQQAMQENLVAMSASAKQKAVIECFSDLCDVFLGTMLRCLRLGFVPEMHGQNIIIVLKEHRFTSLLLRDHDSVRIYLPWLERQQIADPEYLSPPDFTNRLYRETPQTLIFYLQSLGLLVNIRAIIEALVEHYDIAEQELWRTAMVSIEASLMVIDFADDQRELIRKELLDCHYYPHKTLLLPVIDRGDDPHGSMPAGESRTTNPFIRVESGNLFAVL